MRTSGSYAGVVSRGLAFSIDATVVGLACTAGFVLVQAIFAAIGVSLDLHDAASAIGYLIALPVVFGIYCAGFWALIGRTPGMLLLGLRVVTVDGGRPGIGRSVTRALAYWVSAIAMIGFIWIAFDARSQGFHDKIAHTFVVYDWPERVLS